MLYAIIFLNAVAYFTKNHLFIDVSTYLGLTVAILSTLLQFTALVAICAGYVDMSELKAKEIHSNSLYAYSRIIGILGSYILINVGYIGVWLACLCFIEYLVHLSYFNYKKGK